MVRQQHGLNGHEFEQTLGGGDGQGSLECCSPWDHKESDMTEKLNNNNHILTIKKNGIMPLAATWMDLEIIIPSDINQRKILYDITYMRNLKHYTNECIYKTEIDP